MTQDYAPREWQTIVVRVRQAFADIRRKGGIELDASMLVRYIEISADDCFASVPAEYPTSRNFIEGVAAKCRMQYGAPLASFLQALAEEVQTPKGEARLNAGCSLAWNWPSSGSGSPRATTLEVGSPSIWLGLRGRAACHSLRDTAGEP